MQNWRMYLSVCIFSSTKIWIGFEMNLILDSVLKLLSKYSPAYLSNSVLREVEIEQKYLHSKAFVLQEIGE
jgi:hypothetical protein